MWIDIDQNTDEWLDLRAGKVTGSAVACVMANYGKAFGDPAKRLAVNIAIEQITGRAIRSNYTNADMERGHEMEPFARMMYEDETFNTVTNGGFFDNGFTGCSPDGLCSDDLVIEIKSVIPSVQYKRVKYGKYDSAYHWQLCFNLKETGRTQIDYVSYCAEFPTGKQLFIDTLRADDLQEEFKKIDLRLAEFKELVDQIKQDIKQ